MSTVPTHLKDPVETRYGHATVNATVLVERVASAWERCVVIVQMSQTLPVLAINDAGTKRRPAT